MYVLCTIIVFHFDVRTVPISGICALVDGIDNGKLKLNSANDAFSELCGTPQSDGFRDPYLTPIKNQDESPNYEYVTILLIII